MTNSVIGTYIKIKRDFLIHEKWLLLHFSWVGEGDVHSVRPFDKLSDMMSSAAYHSVNRLHWRRHLKFIVQNQFSLLIRLLTMNYIVNLPVTTAMC